MEIIRPGMFGTSYSADSKRRLFDFLNHQILTKGKIPDFLFIGDSITEYWDLELYFQNAGFIVNRGIGGDISSIILKRFDADALQLKPKNIIYLAGCNDLMATHYDYWWKCPGREEKEAIEELLDNTEAIIKKCGGINLYICSVLPSALCVPYDAEKFNDNILTVNKALKKLCEKYSVSYIDYHSALCGPDKKTVMDNITYDGIHPNPEGYEIMAGVLKKAIGKING